jgi:hypothetical protein
LYVLEILLFGQNVRFSSIIQVKRLLVKTIVTRRQGSTHQTGTRARQE